MWLVEREGVACDVEVLYVPCVDGKAFMTRGVVSEGVADDPDCYSVDFSQFARKLVLYHHCFGGCSSINVRCCSKVLGIIRINVVTSKRDRTAIM